MPRTAPPHPDPLPQGARPLWVRAAVTRRHEPRLARALEEWRLEPVLGSGELVLSLALADGGTLTVLLQAEEAEDLAAAVARLRPPPDGQANGQVA